MINIDKDTQELWAFWKYGADFPYICCGQVSILREEKVYIPSFLMWVKPFKLVEGPEGLRLKESIQELIQGLEQDKMALDRKYNEKLDELLEIPGVNT